ncbi:SCO family protein [Leptothoe spongobia]|uniref:SCO family protein n=1 Tax=Leptothoe spongobia TAU-MAC 1115 TaxID=1967444 RepID=A0A947DHC2_9CYAN|nr:SCO family protein [Leptothoe spongobia]MBT9316921.1 SCO family protein [Leptothoe spongobia TAU-MAC 1115]
MTESCTPPRRGPYADYFPNVIVYDHEHQKARFYDDLLLDRMVLINCMSVQDDAVRPVTQNLLQVQNLLGHRLGRDVFMYSLTIDPERDTPTVLRAFADHHGVKPGWQFLTGTSEVMTTLRDRLFAHSGGHAPGTNPESDCSMGMIRYGNESVGLWGSVATLAKPEQIVQRVAWITPRAQPEGAPRRSGPLPLTSENFGHRVNA